MEWTVAAQLVGMTIAAILPLFVVLLSLAACVVGLTFWLYRVGAKK